MTTTALTAPTDPVLYQAWLEESLTTREAAEFLKVEESWLQRRRCTGDGPRFTRLTPKIFIYVRRDLLEFRDAHKHQSTSEYRTQRLPEAAEGGSGSPESSEGGVD